ncbi:MAG TPA: aspartyl protease family protein [Candidatus Limnocylindrales bacterium]|nr:aspartyl protease family protein [Candidatus Limnocylindrales bacterium]
MKTIMRTVPLLLVLAALALPPDAAAQMYRWTDDRGQVFYTQGIDSVPDRYRAGARSVGAVSAPEPVVAPQKPGAPAGGTPAGTATVPGVTRITFTPGKPIMVKARINEGGTADLMLDTGAQVTVINPRVLAALGVSMRQAERSVIRGVTGSTDTLSVSLESVEVSGARVGPLRVVSHDVGFESDGLLGRDFLDRFTVNIDNNAGVVTLAPRATR